MRRRGGTNRSESVKQCAFPIGAGGDGPQPMGVVRSVNPTFSLHSLSLANQSHLSVGIADWLVGISKVEIIVKNFSLFPVSFD